MKLPNGYGSVVKLSGKRRKPYRKYLEYAKENKRLGTGRTIFLGRSTNDSI